MGEVKKEDILNILANYDKSEITITLMCQVSRAVGPGSRGGVWRTTGCSKLPRLTRAHIRRSTLVAS